MDSSITNHIQNLQPGDHHYKAYVGPPEKYDLVGAMQFNLLTSFGLRDYHTLLDIGCGSLRAGKLLIPFLRRGNYFGIEPNEWLLDDGIEHELGKEILSIKSPVFSSSSEFDMRFFNQNFDFIIAQSIFSHATSDQIQTCLEEAKQVLKKEGYFLATFLVGSENYTGPEWLYPECVAYKHPYIKALAKQQNLDVLKVGWAHPNRQTWYVFFHPENRKSTKHILANLFNINQQSSPFVDFIKRQKLVNNSLVKKICRAFR